MKKSRFTETQIVAMLLRTIRDGHLWKGITSAKFYSCKRKYGGMDAQQLKELKSLQDENRRLMTMYADLSLDHHMLKDIIEKKTLRPCGRRELAEGIVKEEGLSIARACTIVCLCRSMWYCSIQRDDGEVIDKLT